MNRLRMEQRAGLTSAKRELVRLEGRRKKLVELVMDGVPGREVKASSSPSAIAETYSNRRSKPPTSRHRCFPEHG